MEREEDLLAKARTAYKEAQAVYRRAEALAKHQRDRQERVNRVGSEAVYNWLVDNADKIAAELPGLNYNPTLSDHIEYHFAKAIALRWVLESMPQNEPHKVTTLNVGESYIGDKVLHVTCGARAIEIRLKG